MYSLFTLSLNWSRVNVLSLGSATWLGRYFHDSPSIPAYRSAHSIVSSWEIFARSPSVLMSSKKLSKPTGSERNRGAPMSFGNGISGSAIIETQLKRQTGDRSSRVRADAKFQR